MTRERSASGAGVPRNRPRKGRRNASAGTLPFDSPASPARPAPTIASPAPTILPRLEPAKISEVHHSYWRFAAERQRIFFKRARGAAWPWTDDPVLSIYKFTNAYRASDRVSQYLIRRVIYRDDLPCSPREVFFRVILFKLFNKIETWETLERSLGAVVFEDYRFARYDDILMRERNRGAPIYSAAYVMPPGRGAFGHSVKHRSYLKLLERMMDDDVPDRLTNAGSMREGFDMLRAYPGIGDFLAYQFISDINYSEIVDFSEMEFVVPGPGARDGLRKCFTDFGGFTEPELIRLTAELQEHEFERRGLRFESLWGRPLQLVDCQNLFCEIGKYARVAHPQAEGRSGHRRIKQKFNPNPEPISLFYPPKWGLNEKVIASMAAQGGEGADPKANKKAGTNFNRYQKEALRTDGLFNPVLRDGVNDDRSLTVAMLGLAGESGQLLSEYKKHLRGGEAHRLYKERVSEELGDLLWYIARVASEFGLDLSEVADANLSKVRNRRGDHRAVPPDLDAAFFNHYQEEALSTADPFASVLRLRDGVNEDHSLTVAMLGLAGKSGQLLSEYQKHLRDGDAHRLCKERVSEALGDLLWYIARVASEFGLDLSEVADANLSKIRNRWGDHRAVRRLDAKFPDKERLPPRFEVELVDMEDGDGRKNTSISVNGEEFGETMTFGATLTDNAYEPDGYRFHDIFHFAYAAILGWSPVTRAFLRRKRKSETRADEVEDGGRAAVIEEAIAALAFDYARRHNMLKGVGTVDSQLLRTIMGMVAHLEVCVRTAAEWERAILQGFKVWRKVSENRGGRVAVDTIHRRIKYDGDSSTHDSREEVMLP